MIHILKVEKEAENCSSRMFEALVMNLNFPLEQVALLASRKEFLADAPRQWYLRLHRALTERGWERSAMDFACWLLWNKDRSKVDGIVLSHVDDLLLGGNAEAKKQIEDLGRELGFGSVEEGSFNYCGKKISQLADGTIRVSMEEYHKNIQTVPVATARKMKPEAELLPSERRQLRALCSGWWHRCDWTLAFSCRLCNQRNRLWRPS